MSFEVKSESDDLSGKNLLCNYKKKYTSYDEKGFEFLSSSYVNFYYINTWKKSEKYGDSSVKKYEYETSLKFIFIQDNSKHIINRKTLEFHYRVGLEPDVQCKIFEGNLKDYFIKKKKRLKKKFVLKIKYK